MAHETPAGRTIGSCFWLHRVGKVLGLRARITHPHQHPDQGGGGARSIPLRVAYRKRLSTSDPLSHRRAQRGGNAQAAGRKNTSHRSLTDYCQDILNVRGRSLGQGPRSQPMAAVPRQRVRWRISLVRMAPREASIFFLTTLPKNDLRDKRQTELDVAGVVDGQGRLQGCVAGALNGKRQAPNPRAGIRASHWSFLTTPLLTARIWGVRTCLEP